ncbi:MAG: hypothetical protein ACRC6E_14380, partial [Fusobacteriaceae bacterium]
MFKAGDIVKLKDGRSHERLVEDTTYKVLGIQDSYAGKFLKLDNFEETKSYYTEEFFELVEQDTIEVITLSELEGKGNELFFIKKLASGVLAVYSRLTNSQLYMFSDLDEEDIVIIDLMTFGFDIKLKELTFERFQEFYKSRTFIKGEENYYIEF